MRRADFDYIACATINTYCLAAPGVEYRPGQTLGSRIYPAKLAFLRNAIYEMGCPDLLFFQEVYHRRALEELLSEMPEYRGVTILMAPDALSEPRVALVSRLPITEPMIIEEFPPEAVLTFGDYLSPISTFRRPVPSVVVQLPNGLTLRVFGLHWKSLLGVFEDGEDRKSLLVQDRAKRRAAFMRECESSALRLIGIQDLEVHDRPLLFAGDCNSPASDGVVQNFLGEFPWTGLPREQKERVWKTRFWDIGEYFSRESAQSGLFTYHHSGKFCRFDVAMTSYHLYGPSPHSLGYFDDYWVYANHLKGALKGWRASTISKSKSDHAFPWFQLGFRKSAA